MKKLSIIVVLAVLVLTGCAQESAEAPGNENTATIADVVYINGKIYTVDESQPWAEAIAVKDGKFIFVGSVEDVQPYREGAAEVIDLKGRMVTPGFIDSHVHPLTVADSWANVQIEEPTNQDAMLAQIKAYAEANPDMPMIRGEAWNLGVFENNSPRKELLDAIDSTRPIFIISQTGHSAWANSKALEMAGITKDTPNGGKFVFDVDPETGEPSGTVKEFAMGAIEQILPPTEPALYKESIKTVMREFASYGFTSLNVAEGSEPIIAGAAALDREGGLDLRLFPSWEWRSHYARDTEEQQDSIPFEWEEYATDKVYPRYVKMFYDGAPDSYTARLFDDYVGRPGDKGASNETQEVFLERMLAFNAKGIGIQVHVLGDAGAAELVELYKEVRKRNGDNDAILHFSHGWLARPDVFPELKKVTNSCVDFSPALNYPSEEIDGSMAPPLGEERYNTFFNVRSAFEAGLDVGFGSDWASALIPEPNVFHQMQSWMTRKNPQDPEGSLNPDQAITLEQALKGMTIGGVKCLGQGWDQKLGSIEVGKFADFAVLSANVFEVPVEALYKTRVDFTVVGGEIVYDRTTDDGTDPGELENLPERLYQ